MHLYVVCTFGLIYGLYGATALDEGLHASTTSCRGYKMVDNIKRTERGYSFPLIFNCPNNKYADMFGRTINELMVEIDLECDDRLHVKIVDVSRDQPTVPDSPLGFQRPIIESRAKNPNYQFRYTRNPFGFKVVRKSDKVVIFNTMDHPLVFEDQYLEISTTIPKKANIYGLGEVTAPFRRTHNITTIFARDNADDFYRNIYGSHPYYAEIRDGKAHGVLLMSSHGMDVITAQSRITYKVIGGIFDFYFFVPTDSTPNSLSVSYTDLVGKPFLPAHWMLGWHHCRYGYRNIEAVEIVARRYREANIPLQTVWIDIDYMEQTKDFTVDNINFPLDRVISFGEQLHIDGQHYVMMVDPAISANTSYTPYTRGIELEIFMKNPDGTEYLGQVWPGYTAFPDWFHPNIGQYWDKEIIDWVNLIGLDGLWIDMNEPSSFCLGSCGTGKVDAGVQPYPWTFPQEERDAIHAEQENALIALGNPPGETRNLLYPKYAINNGAGNLSEATVAMTALHYGGVPHYDLHNLYGHAEGYITREALLKNKGDKRPFILSRSSFVGSGKIFGHWTGDNHSLWSYLKISIANVLSMQMFGITYSGADVCGFNGDTTEELCTRWMSLGAFYPFARNHNGINQVDQEPYLWKTTTEASRIALGIRYSLLPYYYTTFEASHRLGVTVWRPLVFEFPEYDSLTSNDEQFLIGGDILISPVLEEHAVSVSAQFPEGLWYDWYTYGIVEGTYNKKYAEYVQLDAPITHIPIHIRGGSIIATKTPMYTIEETYKTDYKLIIALDNRFEATGTLYIDDGESVEVKSSSFIRFKYNHGRLTATGRFGYDYPELLSTITLVGKGVSKFQTVYMDDKSFDVQQDKENSVIVTNMAISLTGPFMALFE
ncbi:alpha glucosidase [Pilobolus umbonatus]|nr:alpha glucosidase [Pilobolus umbonatus]